MLIHWLRNEFETVSLRALFSRQHGGWLSLSVPHTITHSHPFCLSLRFNSTLASLENRSLLPLSLSSLSVYVLNAMSEANMANVENRKLPHVSYVCVITVSRLYWYEIRGKFVERTRMRIPSRCAASFKLSLTLLSIPFLSSLFRTLILFLDDSSSSVSVSGSQQQKQHCRACYVYYYESERGR